MSRIKQHAKQTARPKAKAGVIAPNSRPSRFEEYDYKIPGPAGKRKSAQVIKPREAGRNMGGGFARLSGAQMQRAEHMADAIASGFRNAVQRDAVTSELSQDADHLSSMGFYGRHGDD
jgi:hypothetical protein